MRGVIWYRQSVTVASPMGQRFRQISRSALGIGLTRFQKSNATPHIGAQKHVRFVGLMDFRCISETEQRTVNRCRFNGRRQFAEIVARKGLMCR